MIYTISKIETVALKTGRVKKSASLKEEGGVEHHNVTIWSSWPNFANLDVGQRVDGNIEVTQNGQYTNKTLQHGMNPNGTYKPTPNGSNFANKGGIKQAQERKETMIEKAQDNKELGIKISSTMRMAVDIVVANIAMQPNVAIDPVRDTEKVQNGIRNWRKWLWQEWENYPKSPIDINEAPMV